MKTWRGRVGMGMRMGMAGDPRAGGCWSWQQVNALGSGFCGPYVVCS